MREDLELDLFDAGLIDSLSTIGIILAIEKKLGLKLQPTDIEKIDISSANHFIAFLERKGKQ
ncbi:MAG: phosphopantetheine-binding protein [Oscillospiraceae bacterium]